MRDLTTEELRAIDKRVIEVLRGLQLYEPRGAVDGAFAEDVAVLAGFVRGEIREAVYRMAADQPAATDACAARRVGVQGPCGVCGPCYRSAKGQPAPTETAPKQCPRCEEPTPTTCDGEGCPMADFEAYRRRRIAFSAACEARLDAAETPARGTPRCSGDGCRRAARNDGTGLCHVHSGWGPGRARPKGPH